MQGLLTGRRDEAETLQAGGFCLQLRKLVLHSCPQPSGALAPVERQVWYWNATQVQTQVMA